MAVLGASGCGSILDIKVYDDDAQNSTIPPDSTAPDQSSESSSRVDAATDVAVEADATTDHPEAATSDSGVEADARRDAPDDAHASDALAGDTNDASEDTQICRDLCTSGMVRCSADNGSAEACEVGADGCTSWMTTTTCGPHQTCTAAAGSATCTCLSSICTQAGTACQDSQTVATCAADANACFYVASISHCATPMSCSGDAPNATCSVTCTNTCNEGQTTCASGALATCTLGTNGCLSYGAPVACGTRQSCAGAAGSAKCACNVDPVCSGLGSVCVSSSAYAVCAQDAQGCFYQASTPPCMNQACVAGICTGMCTPGTTSQCATCEKCDSSGTCSVVSDGTPCETGGQVCTGGSCGCPSGMHLCGGSCVPDDANACGPSCTKCTAGQGCFAETCGCTTSAGCPTGQACNPSTHACSTACDGITLKCNGGCCNSGTCDPGIGAPPGPPCGSGGLQCAQQCQLSACNHFTTWNGGSCECNQDSVCTGNPTGPRCVGNAAAGAGICGCLSDADCGSNKCNLVGANGFPGGYCQ